jgi:hypothetical protein
MDIETLGHILHGLLVDKHGPECFITSLYGIARLQKELFASLTAHGYLLAECHPFLPRTGHSMSLQQNLAQEQKEAFGPQKAGKMAVRPLGRHWHEFAFEMVLRNNSMTKFDLEGGFRRVYGENCHRISRCGNPR